MADIFSRLAKGRPQAAPKLGNSELADDLAKLHHWLQHGWTRPTVRARDICYRGPNSMRKRARAIGLAEILVGHGWLIPSPARRRDTKEWRIVRGTGAYPTLATAPPAPLQSDSPPLEEMPRLSQLSRARW
jgi:hypothetical protein